MVCVAIMGLFMTVNMKENSMQKDNGIVYKDAIHHPPHYTSGSVEVIDQMVAIWGAEKVAIYCEINAFKYRMRAGLKGSAVEDIEKAKWYSTKREQLLKTK